MSLGTEEAVFVRVRFKAAFLKNTLSYMQGSMTISRILRTIIFLLESNIKSYTSAMPDD